MMTGKVALAGLFMRLEISDFSCNFAPQYEKKWLTKHLLTYRGRVFTI